MLDLRKKIRSLPHSPGIYLFKDKQKKVIYVGRAGDLKKRLTSYLFSSDSKTLQTIKEAKFFSFKKTKNLIEAVILETNLIKKHQPKYNIKEKDNRSFIYVIFPKIPWTYPLFVRGRNLKFKPKNTFVFGPFFSFSLAKNLFHLLRKVFPYSTCKKVGKPCFHYQLGLCPGKCLGVISQKEYQKNIENLISFLKGERKRVLKILKKTNPEKIKILKNLDDSGLITKNEIFSGILKDFKIEAYDISHLAGKETVGAMVVYQNNEFDKSQYRIFKIKTAIPHDDLSALLEIFKRRINHSEWKYPDLIIVDGGKNQVRVFEKIINEHQLKIPVIGLSKFKTDKIFFGKLKRPLKELIFLSLNDLLKIRNEAHRFANYFRKRITKKYIFSASLK